MQLESGVKKAAARSGIYSSLRAGYMGLIIFSPFLLIFPIYIN